MYDSAYEGMQGMAYEHVRVFSLYQRIGRLRFACYSFAWALSAALLSALAALFAQALGGETQRLLIIVPILAGAASLVWLIGLMVRRLHDMDLSGYWVVLGFVPVLGILFYLYLLLVPSDSGLNSYGPPVEPNNRLIRWLGGFIWAVCLVAGLAALSYGALMFARPELIYNLQHSSSW
jgi:uncharacterized membrane protein YhaH (DUF805 family)